MTNEYLKRPAFRPSPEEIRERMARWYQAMELSHTMLMAGLRHRVGPDGDVMAAYREWYERYQDLKWRDIEAAQVERAWMVAASEPPTNAS